MRGSQDSTGHAQWNIFFFQQKDLDMEVFEKRIEAHPFVAKTERQAEKPRGGHLSPWNLRFDSHHHFSVLCGYTKHGDGKPRQARQMTHLWMKLTEDNKGPDGVEHNLQLLANLLCEIARFELPYPEVFGVERPRLLESDVGDRTVALPSATAVGVASTVIVGHIDTPAQIN